MNYADSFSYFVTVFAIAIAPGPVVLMLMVRSASDDLSGAINFGVGFAIGGVLIITAVCFGLGIWLTAVPEFFEYSKYIMMAYILFLARGIWKGGFDMSADAKVKKGSGLRSVGGGMATCLISPYMMILFPLVLPGMMDVSVIKMPDFLIIALVTFIGIAIAAGLVIGFAAQLRRLVRSPRSAQMLNRALSGLLVIGGGTLAFT